MYYILREREREGKRERGRERERDRERLREGTSLDTLETLLVLSRQAVYRL